MRNGRGGKVTPGKPGSGTGGDDCDGNGNGKRGTFPGKGGKSDGNGGTPVKGNPGGKRYFISSEGF